MLSVEKPTNYAVDIDSVCVCVRVLNSCNAWKSVKKLDGEQEIVSNMIMNIWKFVVIS